MKTTIFSISETIAEKAEVLFKKHDLVVLKKVVTVEEEGHEYYQNNDTIVEYYFEVENDRIFDTVISEFSEEDQQNFVGGYYNA